MLSWHVFRFKVTFVLSKPKGQILRREAVPPPGLHEWSKTYLKGRWTWGSGEQDLRPYYIEDKADAMLFKLTWFSDVKKPVINIQ